jgi:ketosteroid isomerase-like protein
MRSQKFKIGSILVGTLALAFALAAEGGRVIANPEVKQSSRDAIVRIIDMQKKAWNSGDLDTFLTGYYDSPDTSYTSGGQEYWGYEALKQKYTRSYGTSRDTMGMLDFSELKVVDVSADSAYCLGHWHLERKDKPSLEGVFTLVFKNTTAGWKIIHDHTTSTR